MSERERKVGTHSHTDGPPSKEKQLTVSNPSVLFGFELNLEP